MFFFAPAVRAGEGGRGEGGGRRGVAVSISSGYTWYSAIRGLVIKVC